MFCKKCGAKNDDDAIFCVSCGTKINETQNSVNASQEINQNEASDNQASSENVFDNQGYSFFQQETNVPEENKENDGINETGTVEPAEAASTTETEKTLEPQNTTNNFNVPNQQINNFSQTEKVNKFSFKRFIFSAIVLIATILSCATFFMNYLSIQIKVKGQGSEKRYIKGTEIMKGDVTEDEVWLGDEKREFDYSKTIKWCTIALGVVTVVFAVIELVLLIAVRRRGAYVLITLFSLIKLGLGGYIGYVWCIKLLNILRDSYAEMAKIIGMTGYKITLTAGFGIGFILLMVAQLVTFICSIVLMTCKNRKKIQYN